MPRTPVLRRAVARLPHRLQLRTSARRWLTAGVVATTAVAVVGVGAQFASGAPQDVSHSSARFLSGSLIVGGDSLDNLAAVQGVVADNPGGAPQTSTSGLNLSLLNALTVSLPNLGVPLFGDFLSLGAVNQYAQAADNGISRAASGAVGNDGVVSLDGSGGFPSSATLDLTSILGALNAGVLTTATLGANAITGVASLNAENAGAPATSCTDLSNPAHCRGYNIASAGLNLRAPLAAAIRTSVNSALTTLNTTLNSTLETSLLTGLVGEITSVVNTLGLGLVSLGTSTLAVNVTADITGVLDAVLAANPLTDGVVSINLATGDITADVTALSGRAPNTAVNIASIVTDVLGRIDTLLSDPTTGLQALLSTALSSALDAVTATISGSVELVVAAVPVAGLNVSYNGTLGDLATGAATIGVEGTGVLGALAAIVSALLVSLPTVLDGVVSPVLTNGLTTVNAAAATAVTALTTALTPVLEAVDNVLGLTVNVQETPVAGTYREVALRVSLLEGAGAVLNLGRAEVGANDVTPFISAMTNDHGPLVGGNTVTVTGAHFASGTTVTFNGQTITPNAINPAGTQLTFTVPPGTVSGGVVVTVTNGFGTSPPSTYTYDPPTLTATGPVRPGDSAPVASTGWPPTTVVTVQLAKGGSAVGAPITVTTTASGAFPAGTHVDVPASATLGTYTVTGTDAAGDSAADNLQVAAIAGVFASSLNPTSGPVAGGQTVTIRGAGFEADSTVTIGGITVTPKTIDANGLSLTFVTPPHAAGPVGVTVNSHGLTSDPLTYTYIPAPVASTIDPDRGPVSGGQLVTITGSNFAADSQVTIGGKIVTPQFVAPAGTSLTFITPSHAAGPVEVTVTTRGGTSAPLTYTYVPDDELPPPPVITDPPQGGVVTDPTPPISGTGEPGGSVDVIEGGVVICTGTVDAGGTWTCTPAADLPVGSHTITAQQTVNKLTSGLSDPVTFTVMTGGPGLETTGADVGNRVLAGLLLVLVGVGFLVVARSRRRRTE